MIAMTTDTTPQPYVASASSEISASPGNPAAGGLAFRVFDKDTNYEWQGTAGVDGAAWVQIDAGAGFSLTLTRYTVGVESFTPHLFPDRTPSAWQVLASNNAMDWTVLDTRSGQNWGSFFSSGPVTRSYACAIDIAVPYRFLRLNITANHGGLITTVTTWGMNPRFDHFY